MTAKQSAEVSEQPLPVALSICRNIAIIVLRRRQQPRPGALPSVPAAAPPPPPPSSDYERLCVVCMEGEWSHILIPCFHLCLCEACATSQTWVECPVCRTPAQSVQRIYAP